MSKYFSFRELIESDTAKYHGVSNIPHTLEIFRNLDNLMYKTLDIAREKLGQPILVNSGFRSDIVNTLVHGAFNSQHCKGEAADIRPKNSGDLMRLWKIITDELPAFDQAILYKNKGFIHISLKREGLNRHEILYNFEK